MEPMLVLVVVLVVLLLIAVGGCVWLLMQRMRLVGEVVRASAERDQAVSSLGDRDRRAEAAEQRAARLGDECAALGAELAAVRERLKEREERFARELAGVERQARERGERDERALRELNERFQAAFAELAGRALKESSSQFLQLAEQSFAKHQQASGSAFDERQKRFAELVAPISETLKKTDEKLGALDKARVQTEERLSERVQGFMNLAGALGDATRALTQSLRAPQVRGRWGEMQLRRVVELAGMSEHCDFDTQATVKGEGGNLRPDMLIHLPGERTIVVDAKAPLHAYLEAIEAGSDEERGARLKAHARQLRDRVMELSGKAYQNQFDATPDFTVLFVPGDQFLSAALMEQPELLEEAASRQVILTTPATLIALLKAVQYGWSQASLASDAREVLRLGRELHERVSVLSGHLESVGKGLERAVKAYNDAVGSYESRLVPGASRLAEHNIRATRSLADVKPVTTHPRALAGGEDGSGGSGGGGGVGAGGDEPGA
ncbi:MAG: DNA recombination protein RmuC [Phycisphaerales bacterium]